MWPFDRQHSNTVLNFEKCISDSIDSADTQKTLNFTIKINTKNNVKKNSSNIKHFFVNNFFFGQKLNVSAFRKF